MTNGALFRWEDTPNLNHHCGYCKRPLSHPTARTTCFGIHAEPCHRYHQQMFMRNKAHTCSYCATVDKEHHKRHTEIAEKLRRICSSGGEVGWTIIPYEPEAADEIEPTDARTLDRDETYGFPILYEYEAGDKTAPADAKNSSRGETDSVPILCEPEEGDRTGPVDTRKRSESETDGVPITSNIKLSKKERKKKKQLMKAAQRPRVITLDEINYVGSIIHLKKPFDANNKQPPNSEEEGEMEQDLEYNFQVHSSKEYRHEVRRLTDTPEGDVDLDYEIQRILDTFRINQLHSRIKKDRVLQGKGLKAFEDLVVGFTKSIVEDIEIVNKDEGETGMRRAGYFRYANRASLDIVEERYKNRDWKSGERINPTPEATRSQSVENLEPQDNDLHLRDSGPISPSGIIGADRRHIDQTYQKICDDGTLEQVVAPSYHRTVFDTHESKKESPSCYEFDGDRAFQISTSESETDKINAIVTGKSKDLAKDPEIPKPNSPPHSPIFTQKRSKKDRKKGKKTVSAPEEAPTQQLSSSRSTTGGETSGDTPTAKTIPATSSIPVGARPEVKPLEKRRHMDWMQFSKYLLPDQLGHISPFSPDLDESPRTNALKLGLKNVYAMVEREVD